VGEINLPKGYFFILYPYPVTVRYVLQRKLDIFITVLIQATDPILYKRVVYRYKVAMNTARTRKRKRCTMYSYGGDDDYEEYRL
jgi:hypothetical protein